MTDIHTATDSAAAPVGSGKRNLNSEAPCGPRCCLSLRQYIDSHLDPGANLKPTDNAAEIIAGLNRVFASEGGAGVSVGEMQEYLDGLATS
jgi:hypothetical protein